ncbi:MAG: Wzz/FepE/Etk N-terminal domain-containing protein [Clostridiales bacterium]|uniref:YveK family protein n=1 Tax=Terrisporobacter sp. TaxID=1965305 RepID=UPI002A50BC4C|nr:Wzz/FepE/Etk N-terminal domain-containing protein [Terrisporobacter sp.]MDD7756240.1 Wzz/FepE/Etk N-terminal domain-containing protein [Clostridiales bacterium]MDY4137602.1 Wzz/FepE/Etk N-terminal domain-containing protein [Terrisporobacter sp.]
MEEQVISISEIIDAVKKRWKIIALTTVLATLVSGIFSFFVISPTYEASTKVFIGKEESSMESYNYNDITMYQKLLKTYSELIKTKDLINRAITNSKYELKVKEVLDDVSVTIIADTQMIQIAYRSTSPNIAKNMLENITNEFIVTAQELVPNGNVRILESVELPKNPVAPNKKMNIAIAFTLGMMVGFGIVFLLEYLDNTYKNKEQLEKDLDIPVLGVIPMSDLD